jgi:hypothetical protein
VDEHRGRRRRGRRDRDQLDRPLGYGLDSTIQGIGSLVIIWRLTGARIHSTHVEQRAQKIVAVTFFLLAPTSASKLQAACSPGNRPKAAPGEAAAAHQLTDRPGRTQELRVDGSPFVSKY